ncbi:haloacid dehalogenase, IA family protein, partial [gut metagenome]
EVAVYFKERFQLPESIEEIKEIWKTMAMDRYSHRVLLKPGVQNFLAYLKEREIKMGVASSNDRALIDATLSCHGILDYFSTIVTACEVCAGKPAPDVYLEAAKRLEVQPEECLVFEDIAMGLRAGKSAGMKTCAVKDDYSLSQDVEKRKIADYYIETYDQILDHTYEEL